MGGALMQTILYEIEMEWKSKSINDKKIVFRQQIMEMSKDIMAISKKLLNNLFDLLKLEMGWNIKTKYSHYSCFIH